MPRIRTAHKFSERQRTGDVLTDELVDFKALLLSPDVLKGLNSSGFERPSPIQLKAIPLGRCGLDLIAQAKSGTGKTCVFSVIALESVLHDSNTTQVLILAPTREIAVQIKDVITAIGSQMENMACHVFIGGLPVDENKKILKKPCHIAVGTPGRIKYLIENHLLKTESVRLFILDEADKLLEDSFQEQINWIFSSLPSNKQMMAFSATYPEYLAKHLTRYMREPTFVRLNATDPTLQGIKQFYRLVPFHPLPHKTFQEKVCELLKLLSSLPFHQCLVFSNYQIRAQSLCETLRLKGWPSVFIAGSQTQLQRLKAMERLKQFKCRVLISTDLTSRGIDAENVNLIVNMDVPRDSETYLHRIGRAGRFGTQGIAVTFVARGEEDKLFKRIVENIGTTIDTLPDPIPQSLGTSGTPTELYSAPVQPRSTSIEVDILKGDDMHESEGNMTKNSSHLNKSLNFTRNSEETLDDAGKIICIEDQRSCTTNRTEQESLTDAEILPNQEPQQTLQIEGDAVLSKSTSMEEIISNIQQSLRLDQECEKGNISGKQLENIQRNCDVSQPQSNETEDAMAVTLQEACEVSLCHDLKEREVKTDHKESSQFASSEENSSLVKDSLSKLQVDLKRGSHSESSNSHKEMRNFLNKASEDRDCTRPGNNDETFDYQLPKPSADEENSSGSLSEEEDTSSDESEESSDGLELDVHDTSEPGASGAGHFLPPVDEFERDFEEYLDHVSNLKHDSNPLDNCVESLSHPSELSEDDLDDDGARALHCTEGDDYDRTTAEAHAVTQHLGTYPGTSNQMCDQDGSIGYYNGQYTQTQNPTDESYLYHDKNLLSEADWNYHHPDPSTDINYNDYNQDNYYNYYHNNHDQGYYSPYHRGSYGTNWPADVQRQADSGSSQQYVGQSYADTENYQDYQWNTSWYNAYQRQTSCIRQFVSFSRSARL